MYEDINAKKLMNMLLVSLSSQKRLEEITCKICEEQGKSRNGRGCDGQTTTN